MLPGKSADRGLAAICPDAQALVQRRPLALLQVVHHVVAILLVNWGPLAILPIATLAPILPVEGVLAISVLARFRVILVTEKSN